MQTHSAQLNTPHCCTWRLRESDSEDSRRLCLYLSAWLLVLLRANLASATPVTDALQATPQQHAVARFFERRGAELGAAGRAAVLDFTLNATDHAAHGRALTEFQSPQQAQSLVNLSRHHFADGNQGFGGRFLQRGTDATLLNLHTTADILVVELSQEISTTLDVADIFIPPGATDPSAQRAQAAELFQSFAGGQVRQTAALHRLQVSTSGEVAWTYSLQTQVDRATEDKGMSLYSEIIAESENAPPLSSTHIPSRLNIAVFPRSVLKHIDTFLGELERKL